MIPTTVDSKVLNALFDLNSDPHEMNNLLGQNLDRLEYLKQAEKLRSKLVEWLVKVKSPYLEAVKNRPF